MWFLRTSVAGGQVFQQAQVYFSNLFDGRVLMFNPLRDQGVAVLNRAAYEVWQRLGDAPAGFATEGAARAEHAALIDKMLKAGLLEPVGSRVALRTGAPGALSAWLHVTNQCNLRCDYCYINKTPERLDEDVGVASVDAVFRSAVKGGFRAVKLKFAGGEATLNPGMVLDLDTYARIQANDLGLDYEAVILSNGVSISERLAAECQARGLRLMISLDGVGKGHDLQRRFVNGRASSFLVMRTIERLLAMGMKPFISITVTDRNTETLAETVRFVLERDLPFNINFVRDNDQVAGFEVMRLRDQRIIEAMDEAFAVIEANLPPYELLGMLVDRSNFSQPHRRTCGVGESYLVIDQKGQVAKCHMEIEKPVTDVYVEDPLALVQADTAGVQNPPVEEKEGCRACDWRYWCAGGCPKATYRATGRYDVKSPYCNIYKAIYPKLLRLEALRLIKYAGQRAATGASDQAAAPAQASAGDDPRCAQP